MQLEEIVNPYNDPLSKRRPGLRVKSPWSSACEAYVTANKIKALYFNSAQGWKESDFSFLARLDGIEEINIICSTINHLSALEHITTLQELSISGVVSDTVDFSKLPSLNRCYLYWWKGAESILDLPGLTNAYFDKIKLKDYNALAKLNTIQSLTIANTPMPSLEWLDKLPVLLSELHLLNCRKINDFAPISRQKNLTRLTVSGSKLLYNLDFLSDLVNLEVLDLSDNATMKSLQPLKNLQNLKAVAFAGAKTIIEDGNLSVLESLSALSMLMFAPRRSYSHKLIKQWDWANFDKPDTLLAPI